MTPLTVLFLSFSFFFAFIFLFMKSFVLKNQVLFGVDFLSVNSDRKVGLEVKI